MKYKTLTTAFTLTVILLSLYAIGWPSYDLQLFINTSGTYAMFRSLIVLAIAAYVLLKSVRNKLTQIAMFSVGAALLFLSIISFFSPLLFGHLSYYIGMGDVIIGIEASVLSMLVSVELTVNKLRMPSLTIFKPSFYQNKLMLEHKSINTRPA